MFSPCQTCHRWFQQWVREGILRTVLEALAKDLRARSSLPALERVEHQPAGEADDVQGDARKFDIDDQIKVSFEKTVA
jgi:hypothetical protein